MRRHGSTTTILIGCIAGMWLPACFGQAQASPDIAQSSPQETDHRSLPRFGLAVNIGTLGAGIEAATAIARHTNIRGGFNYFSYSLSGTDSKNNLGYAGSLRLESGEILLDQYLKGGFHISGGALLYDGFQGTGTVHVSGGQSLTLNSVTYYSSASDPVTGTGSITVRKIAPEALIGFGNLLPRSSRHFAVNLDLGVAYQGSLNTRLNLLGSTCATATGGCATISSSPLVQANILAEQSKINNTLRPFQFYPVIRLGFGYKF